MNRASATVLCLCGILYCVETLLLLQSWADIRLRIAQVPEGPHYSVPRAGAS